MRYLLDTHTFLWMAANPSNLSSKVREIVREKDNKLHLSAASGWEIALLQQLNRVELPDEPQRFIPEAMQRLSVLPLPIGFTTAISAAMLPFTHRDPFDRIIQTPCRVQPGGELKCDRLRRTIPGHPRRLLQRPDATTRPA